MLSLGGSNRPGPFLLVPISDPSRVGEARRLAVELARRIGFDEADSGRAALVATELGTNLIKHARAGRLLLGLRDVAGAGALEIVALDDGPGMADAQRCLRDGFSSAGTSGTGLGAVRRQADDFDLHSALPQGTAVLARLFRGRARPSEWASLPLESGAVALAAPREQVCGDAWAMAFDGGGATAMTVDGLGHGAGAAEAARAALDAFAAGPAEPPARFIKRAHLALRPTRGAAVAVLRLDPDGGMVRFAGAGNVQARIVSGLGSKTLLPQSGTVGVQIREPDEQALAWPPHALVVLFTDGVVSRWELEDVGLLGRDSTLLAAWLAGRHRRGHDDATVVVLRRRKE
ncbi:anti-sigma regulatory factor [Pigmentiphaga soli]|uniref:Anti-sigma regulatory factor n=1 Tax=Pigmentiphaga soli TaxID=1007095 RepID=A0ABP8GVU9_9BURK